MFPGHDRISLMFYYRSCVTKSLAFLEDIISSASPPLLPPYLPNTMIELTYLPSHEYTIIKNSDSLPKSGIPINITVSRIGSSCGGASEVSLEPRPVTSSHPVCPSKSQRFFDVKGKHAPSNLDARIVF